MATIHQVVVAVLAAAAVGAAVWMFALVAIMLIGGAIGTARAISGRSPATTGLGVPAESAPANLEAQFETQ